MRYFFIIFFLLIVIPLALFAIEKENAIYVLPRGPAYSHIGLGAPKHEHLYLRFGDKVRIKDEYAHGRIKWYLCLKGSVEFYLPDVFVVKETVGIEYDLKGNIPIGKEVVDKWQALPVWYKPTDLIPVPKKYRAYGYESRKLLLRKEAVEVFIRLIENAEKDGVNIRILSAFRDTRYQSYIYFNSIRRYGIFQNGVAKPGHSEHQLGTTCDLTTTEIGSALSKDFEYTAAYQWLQDHITQYGISLTYTKFKGKAIGYMYEPWHYRYWGKEKWEFFREKYGLFLSR